MHRYINCIAHKSSEGNLLLGEEYTALFDCGMAFCAMETIENIKKALNGRQLDYIFITHTHYDHIGALPFFRTQWPLAKVMATEIGAAVLLKDTPRRVFRELSSAAALRYGSSRKIEYDDNAFTADILIKENDVFSLGGLTVEVIETPGHTRDSVSYFIPELELLILNETPGIIAEDGIMYPCYLTSFSDTISTICKCKNIRYKHVSLPHLGLTANEVTANYFEKSLAMNMDCHNFIVNLNQEGNSEEEIFKLFYKKYGNEVLFSAQPEEAFITNARATIACSIREKHYTYQ